MPERRGALQTLAGVLASLGGGVLINKASGWSDPLLWIGAVGLATGLLILLWLLVSPWKREREDRQARDERALLEGRANQHQGLDEIANELGQISSQLKGELRWGKRGNLFPNTAWAKNEHLVTGEIRMLG
jgi:type VI protein secretion system component VasK